MDEVRPSDGTGMDEVRRPDQSRRDQLIPDAGVPPELSPFHHPSGAPLLPDDESISGEHHHDCKGATSGLSCASCMAVYILV